MKINTDKGVEVLISAKSFELVKDYEWKLNNGYVYRDVVNNDDSRTRLYLHRIVTRAPNGLVVDHINGNTLDNRLENLRICTTAENVRNRVKPRNSTNSYKGVRNRCGNYEASIGSGDTHKYLGTYKTEEDAAIAYNIAATELYGVFARLNGVELPYEGYIPQRIVGTSIYRGVSYSNTFGNWIAKLQANKKRRHLGYYDDEVSAAIAYNTAAKELLGDKAKLNVITA